jgi:hypothetical protein
MSVSSLITQYGESVTRRRLTYSRTTAGGPQIASETTAAITMFLQVGGGSVSPRYGAERSRYEATGYCISGTDILDGDLVDFRTRKYRVESVRSPNDRPVSDVLSYVICELQEDSGT